ncbi:hypothetical protein, partial [Escherichia coli]|uniref:hypothetical protein n=1 Tax=Escherichia coli TaxID=562 RepID=UPI00202BA8FB
MTWYKSVNDIPPIEDYDIIRGKRTYMYFEKEPLFPFGHGLTYTEFSYKNLYIEPKEYKIEEEIKDLRNLNIVILSIGLSIGLIQSMIHIAFDVDFKFAF